MKFKNSDLFLSGILVSTLLTGAGVMGAKAGFSPSHFNLLAKAPENSTVSQGNEGPAITTTSGESELGLARHLQEINAKMYGAYWCPYCHMQEQLFGKEAFEMMNYIECDPRGKNSQTSLCREAKIIGYPTWEINGKFYQGVQSLETLAEISGYEGPQAFQQKFPKSGD